MFKRMGLLAFVGVFFLSIAPVSAEDVFFHASLADLELTEGSLPATNEADWSKWWRIRHKPAYAVLDGEGEAYVKYLFDSRQDAGASGPVWQREIAIRVPQARDVTGRLFLPSWDDKGMQVAKFRLPGSKARPAQRGKFYALKLAHYENLLSSGAPGAAWFRHEVRNAEAALGREAKSDQSNPAPWGGRPRTGELADTYAMFTGGRAMSENLQLDRVLQAATGGRKRPTWIPSKALRSARLTGSRCSRQRRWHLIRWPRTSRPISTPFSSRPLTLP